MAKRSRRAWRGEQLLPLPLSCVAYWLNHLLIDGWLCLLPQAGCGRREVCEPRVDEDGPGTSSGTSECARLPDLLSCLLLPTWLLFYLWFRYLDAMSAPEEGDPEVRE
jgi:hypothetical protein